MTLAGTTAPSDPSEDRSGIWDQLAHNHADRTLTDPHRDVREPAIPIGSQILGYYCVWRGRGGRHRPMFGERLR